jgi:hypothetical protein
MSQEEVEMEKETIIEEDDHGLYGHEYLSTLTGLETGKILGRNKVSKCVEFVVGRGYSFI